ncbi:MAG: hypothetical protein MPW15_07285 [Candidatus Manganitrophus sp.]|nr:hypothetical protein [Candidatus Manganitrophus sp.]
MHEDHINVGGLGLFRSIYIGTKVAISNLNTIPPRKIHFPAARDHCVMEKSSAIYRSEPTTARPKGLDRSLGGTTPLHPLFQLQRNIGNQASPSSAPSEGSKPSERSANSVIPREGGRPGGGGGWEKQRQ